MKAIVPVILILSLSTWGLADNPVWRQATEKELESLIPARVNVEKERIETELRTASGVTNGQGKFIAGVSLITAGYSAEGKYSHLFVTQVALKIGDVALRPGEYAFGFKRMDDQSLEVKFYEAASGKFLVAVKATTEAKRGPIRSLLISPPENGKGLIKIGRFVFEYTVS